MDQLGLEVTKPCHYLYSLDSKLVKRVGMIKDPVVNLAKLPSKRIILDVVVVNVPLYMVCYYQGHVLRGWGEPCIWI